MPARHRVVQVFKGLGENGRDGKRQAISARIVMAATAIAVAAALACGVTFDLSACAAAAAARILLRPR
jgi:ABC-type nitrate/sulfonate/bicarbonate transport system permease component